MQVEMDRGVADRYTACLYSPPLSNYSRRASDTVPAGHHRRKGPRVSYEARDVTPSHKLVSCPAESLATEKAVHFNARDPNFGSRPDWVGCQNIAVKMQGSVIRRNPIQPPSQSFVCRKVSASPSGRGAEVISRGARSY
jgi:hypothetical protein